MSKTAFNVVFNRIVSVGPYATKCAEFMVDDGPLCVPIPDIRDIETAYFLAGDDYSDTQARKDLDQTTDYFHFLKGNESEAGLAMDAYRAWQKHGKPFGDSLPWVEMT